MEIVARQVTDPKQITVLSLSGELDASNYLQVINTVRDLYNGGSRALLLDLTNVTFLSSSGLVALHSIAMLMRGETPPDPEAGWSTFHAVASDIERGSNTCCRLLNPQPRVRKTLDMTGFSDYLHIYDDLDTALAAFP